MGAGIRHLVESELAAAAAEEEIHRREEGEELQQQAFTFVAMKNELGDDDREETEDDKKKEEKAIVRLAPCGSDNYSQLFHLMCSAQRRNFVLLYVLYSCIFIFLYFCMFVLFSPPYK